MNRETEIQFQTDYERRRKETYDYMNEAELSKSEKNKVKKIVWST